MAPRVNTSDLVSLPGYGKAGMECLYLDIFIIYS